MNPILNSKNFKMLLEFYRLPENWCEFSKSEKRILRNKYTLMVKIYNPFFPYLFYIQQENLSEFNRVERQRLLEKIRTSFEKHTEQLNEKIHTIDSHLDAFWNTFRGFEFPPVQDTLDCLIKYIRIPMKIK